MYLERESQVEKINGDIYVKLFCSVNSLHRELAGSTLSTAAEEKNKRL